MNDFDAPFPQNCYQPPRATAFRILLKATVCALAVFGLLFILLLVLLAGFVGSDGRVKAVVPPQAIMTINFDDHFGEMRGDDLLTELAEIKSQSFYDLVKAINLAADDNRIKAVVATIGSSPLGMAQIEDIRQSIAAFRKSGKKAYLFSSGMGSFGNGTGEYLLASAFDEIWMQPGTDIGLTGIDIEVPFLRGLLDKIGITPEFYARHEYKTAMTSLVSKDFTAPYKAELTKLGSQVFATLLKNIAAARNIDAGLLRQLIDKAPLSAKEALAENLIDYIGYRSEMIDKVKENTGGELMPVETYIAEKGDGRLSLPTIAYLVLDGVISEGVSSANPIQGEGVIGAETVAEELEAIGDNENVRVLVIRINSPGGSYTASSQIWHAVKRLKIKRQIPVIISMGDYAASGGYFVALAGDKLIAEPLTLTGSIGVLGGKMVLAGLWQKLDINWGEVKFGTNAGILSANRSFSESEKTVFNKSLDLIYKDFTLKVSQARDISLKDLDKLARGRVLTGQEAVAAKLVDELGGINEALAAAKAAGGIKDGDKFTVAYYPRPKTLQQKLAELINGGPRIKAEKVISQIGLDIKQLNMLQRLQHDAVLPPFTINY